MHMYCTCTCTKHGVLYHIYVSLHTLPLGPHIIMYICKPHYNSGPFAGNLARAETGLVTPGLNDPPPDAHATLFLSRYPACKVCKVCKVCEALFSYT